MKISVIIPCHNCGQLIGEALRSVAAQTYQPCETIVVDDNSTDDSVEAINGSPVTVKLLSASAGNAAAARNVGIRNATGEWIAFLDADNIWFPDHLERMQRILEEGSDIAAYAWPARDRDSGPSGLVSLGPGTPTRRGLSHHHFLELRGIMGFGFPTTGMIIRRTALESVGGFDERQKRRHDFDLFMRVTCSGTWSAVGEPTWWSRPPRAGNISADELACRRYALRAILRHAGHCSSPLMKRVVHREARRSAGFARRDSRPESFELWSDAAPYLRAHEKLLFGIRMRLKKG